MMIFVAGALLTFLPMAFAAGNQAAPPADKWAKVRFMLGSWEGSQAGRPGTGTVRRQYRFVLRDQFIEVRNTSTYPPQEKNPKGEVHDDLGFISYDESRKRLVFRQFHVEGFVNQYVEDPESSSGTLVFVSEAIENIPPDWRARETYIVHAPDEFEEVFELAGPGKPFEVYSRARLKRSAGGQ